MGAIRMKRSGTTDTPWDGPATEAAMPNDASALRYCHAWVDEHGDPDVKGSYKFPICSKQGGPVNLAACRNGLARLGGAHIPDGDKPAVEALLHAYLPDEDEKPGDTDSEGTVDNRYRPGIGMFGQPRPESGWWQITNVTDGESDVYLSDEIGGWGVSSSAFIQDLRATDTGRINLHLNSPGGSAFDGVEIYNALMAHPASVHVTVDGMAASAASVIAMAGDTVTMSPGSSMMIHNAISGAIGNASDLRKTADLLDGVSKNIASIYAARTGQPVDHWQPLMDAETWFHGQEAVDAGLATAITKHPARADALAAVTRWNLTAIYQHAPKPPVRPAPVQPPASSNWLERLTSAKEAQE